MSRVTRGWRLTAAALPFFALAAYADQPQAQTTRTVADGVYTDAQAMRGEMTYNTLCASCHGGGLEGGIGPPLAGEPFLTNWGNQPLSAVALKIRETMPSDAPGSLSPEQTAEIVAYMLKAGGYPAGAMDLPSDEKALGEIGWPKADPAKAAAPPSGGPQAKAYPPVGNMAQLMRAIFFPNSNIIFTVQTKDPGAPAPPPTVDPKAGFSWIDWGGGIYGGWQLVDNAAVALADASPLMLTPGIRCENGRPAPVADAQWIKYTEEMIAVARELYKLSQTRNQQAVADATGDLADACANCHRAYRDVGGGRGRGAGAAAQGGRCASRA